MRDEFRSFRDNLLADPATRSAYEARKPVFVLALQLAELRRRKGLSQAELAKRAGVHQSEVARIESAESSPTFDTMARLLAAAEADLEIRFLGSKGKVERLTMDLRGAHRVPRSPRIRPAAGRRAPA